jgi:hypothetical protein
MTEKWQDLTYASKNSVHKLATTLLLFVVTIYKDSGNRITNQKLLKVTDFPFIN